MYLADRGLMDRFYPCFEDTSDTEEDIFAQNLPSLL